MEVCFNNAKNLRLPKHASNLLLCPFAMLFLLILFLLYEIHTTQMHILFYMFVYVVNVCSSHPSTFPTPAPGRSYVLYDVLTNYKIELNFANIVQICSFTFGIITLLRLSYLHLCNCVRHVCCSHNLSILAKK